MAKPKLVPGRINRRGVGFVESPIHADVLLALARERALSSKPRELRIVISEEIAPSDAPEIVMILKIRGYEARPIDQVFTKAMAKSSVDKHLPISVLNPRVLYYKEKALKKLWERYTQVYISRKAARLRLKGLHYELNKIEDEKKSICLRKTELHHSITSIMIIRAGTKLPPMHLPRSISVDYLKKHFNFLFDPLLQEVDPPVLNSTAAIDEGIIQLRTSLGLPPSGAQKAVADRLTELRTEVALGTRKLATLELDKGLILQQVLMEESAISNANSMLPEIMKMMRTKSTYGADGIEEDEGLGGVLAIHGGGPGILGGGPVVPDDVGGGVAVPNIANP